MGRIASINDPAAGGWGKLYVDASSTGVSLRGESTLSGPWYVEIITSSGGIRSFTVPPGGIRTKTRIISGQTWLRLRREQGNGSSVFSLDVQQVRTVFPAPLNPRERLDSTTR